MHYVEQQYALRRVAVCIMRSSCIYDGEFVLWGSVCRDGILCAHVISLAIDHAMHANVCTIHLHAVRRTVCILGRKELVQFTIRLRCGMRASRFFLS